MIIRQIIDTPWKIINEILFWLSYPIVRLIFAFYRIPWGANYHFYGIPIIQKHRLSRMTFGKGLQLRSSAGSNPLGVNHPVILSTRQAGAVLEIGDDFAMTGGAICAAERIIIGDRVAVGANSCIVDTDFHPLDPQSRQENPSAGNSLPVVIEDDVFIGMNCLILKGVTIGKGSVIGAGSVVTRSIPAQVIAAGNPASVIRGINEH